MGAAFVVLFLWANPVKHSVMLRTSFEFSHNNIRNFFLVHYNTHVCLRVSDQVHNPGIVALKFYRWLQLMRYLVILLIYFKF